MEGFVVQEMVAGGVEMLVGVAHDPHFEPVVAVGAGGTTVELLRDVAVRVTPISDLHAREMVRSLGTFPLLDGFRGASKADVAALEEIILSAVTSAVLDRPRTGKHMLKDEKLARLSPQYHKRPVERGPDGSVASVVRVRR